jgi:hypothetical protein
MANVTIKLTVDTVAVLNDPKDPQLGTNCSLSQAGGEDIGNYMVIDPSNSEENISHVTEGDVITWVGIPANGNVTNQINIISIHKDDHTGGSVLGASLDASWTFGSTIIRQALVGSTGDKETYTINFIIDVDGVSTDFSFDPKIQVHQP